METAIMIDGAFLRKRFRGVYKRYITAKDIQDIVTKIFLIASLDINKDHRVYFYDCSPCAEMTSLPVSHKLYNFEATNQFKRGVTLLDDIRRLSFFAVREGQLSFCGWRLKKSRYNEELPHTDDSFEPELHQKTKRELIINADVCDTRGIKDILPQD